jgi:hypothetical protein
LGVYVQALVEEGQAKNETTPSVAVVVVVPDQLSPQASHDEKIAVVVKEKAAEKVVAEKKDTPSEFAITKKKGYEFGDNFFEANGNAGGYHAFGSGVNGGYGEARGTYWIPPSDSALNLGFGPSYEGGYGKNPQGYQWKHNSVGVNLDYYQAYDPSNDLILRLEGFYRWNGYGRGSGFQPAWFTKYTHSFNDQSFLFTSDDALELSFLGHYYRNDSWGSVGFMIAHEYSENITFKYGFDVNANFLKDHTFLGVGPDVAVSIGRYVDIGAGLTFTSGGPVAGAWVGLKYSTAWRDKDGDGREKSVVKKVSAENSQPLPTVENVSLKEKANGEYAINPGMVIDEGPEVTLRDQVRKEGVK